MQDIDKGRNRQNMQRIKPMWCDIATAVASPGSSKA